MDMEMLIKSSNPYRMRLLASGVAAAFYCLGRGEMRVFEPVSTAFW